MCSPVERQFKETTGHTVQNTGDSRLQNFTSINRLPRELIKLIMHHLSELDFINFKQACFKLNHIGKQLQATPNFINKIVLEHNLKALSHFYFSLACSNKHSFREGKEAPSNGIEIDQAGRIIKISWGNCSGSEISIRQLRSSIPSKGPLVNTEVFRITSHRFHRYEITLPAGLCEERLTRIQQLNAYSRIQYAANKRRNKKPTNKL